MCGRNYPENTIEQDLRRYDNKCVRIIDSDGDAFDGICHHNGAEYDEHEYGRAEEGLQIENFLFFKSDIKEIRILDDNKGPYGRFLDPYGKLEILTVEDGIDSIEEILFSEENEHVIRLLNCLEYYLDPASALSLPDRERVPDVLRKLLEVNSEPDVQKKAWEILDSIRS